VLAVAFIEIATAVSREGRKYKEVAEEGRKGREIYLK
jgi:hypothetical protein